MHQERQQKVYAELRICHKIGKYTFISLLVTFQFSFFTSKKSTRAMFPKVEEENVEIVEYGNWIVESFNDENNSYIVAVDDCKVIECSCYCYRRHQRPCKHPYLLDIHVNEFSILRNSTGINMLTHQTQDAPPLPSSSQTNSGQSDMTSTERIPRRAADIACTIHHSNENLISMKNYIENEKANDLLLAYDEAFSKLQSLKDKYSSHFRTLNTQINVKYKNVAVMFPGTFGSLPDN
jgi:hypothetical protein